MNSDKVAEVIVTGTGAVIVACVLATPFFGIAPTLVVLGGLAAVAVVGLAMNKK